MNPQYRDLYVVSIANRYAVARDRQRALREAADFLGITSGDTTVAGAVDMLNSARRLVADENKAVTLESYPHENSTYYRILGTKRWMSVSNRDYVGFYEVLGWLQATPFTTDGSGHLISQYNHQKLSLYSKDDGYLYCWNDYTVLTVRFVR